MMEFHIKFSLKVELGAREVVQLLKTLVATLEAQAEFPSDTQGDLQSPVTSAPESDALFGPLKAPAHVAYT